MNLYIKLISITFVSLFISACASGGQGLSSAQNLPSVDRVHTKLKKHIAKLYSDDATERAWAAYSIGKSAKLASNTVPFLIAVLDDSDTAVMTRYVGRDYSSATTTTTAKEAAKALGKIGQPAVKPLLVALKNSNNDIVILAIKTLGSIKHNSSIKALVSFLSNKDKRVRLEAANSLSRFRNPWITDYLLATLKNKNTVVRSTALYALGKLKNPVAVPDLIALLNDPDSGIRSQTLYVLSQYRDERVIQPLLDEEKKARGDTSAINYHIEVIGILGNIRDYRVIKVLLGLLDAPNQLVKNAAADSLSQISNLDLGVSSVKWNLWWNNKLKRGNQN